MAPSRVTVRVRVRLRVKVEGSEEDLCVVFLVYLGHVFLFIFVSKNVIPRVQVKFRVRVRSGLVLGGFEASI